MNPKGVDLPVEDLANAYDTMISSGERTFLNFLLFHGRSGQIARRAWNDAAGDRDKIEGSNLQDSRAIKQAVTVPVICTGGFQTASVIRAAIERGDCDAVSAARTLVANNDLVRMFERGLNTAPEPCTYCNKCLVNVVENPLGCYDERRFPSRDAMIAQIFGLNPAHEVGVTLQRRPGEPPAAIAVAAAAPFAVVARGGDWPRRADLRGGVRTSDPLQYGSVAEGRSPAYPSGGPAGVFAEICPSALARAGEARFHLRERTRPDRRHRPSLPDGSRSRGGTHCATATRDCSDARHPPVIPGPPPSRTPVDRRVC